MPDKRDKLAEQRTLLASERTHMALVRTMLGWWRTALGLYGVGLAVARLLPEGPGTLDAWLGEAFVVAGMAVLLAGYHDIAKTSRMALGVGPRWTIIVLTGVLMILGVGAIIVALAV